MKICLRPLPLGCRLPVFRCHDRNRPRCARPLVAASAYARNHQILWARPYTHSRSQAEATQGLDGERSGKNDLFEREECPVPTAQRRNVGAWINYLEQFLPPDLRSSPEQTALSQSSAVRARKDSRREGSAIAALLYHARRLSNFDLLAHLGFELGRWPAVLALTNKMIDSAVSFRKYAPAADKVPSALDLKSLSLDAVTDMEFMDGDQAPETKRDSPMRLDVWTDTVKQYNASQAILGEIWKSLGYIVLQAADLPSEQGELAMKFTYQTLGRLHHFALVSDTVYKYSGYPDHAGFFRPPGMYLLSTYIMDVLSDTAWVTHQEEVTAKAVAAGQEAPFRPFKMGIRQLGPEVWLEFILWCCVEGGHIKEGLWILERMKARQGDSAWKLLSWMPLLAQPERIRSTNVNEAECWPHPDADQASTTARSSAFFHGLGKKTISSDVVAAFVGGVVSQVDQGVGSSELPIQTAIQYVDFLLALLAQHSVERHHGIEKSSAQRLVWLLESQGLDPHIEPKALQRLLTMQPPTPIPWDDSVPVDYKQLKSLSRTHLYSTSSALVGLLELNIRVFAIRRHIRAAFDVFSFLQNLIDQSKLQHMRGFLDQMKTDDHGQGKSLPPSELIRIGSVSLGISSIPQLSRATFAHLLDLARVARAFSFGEWMLFSTDPDGVAIPMSAYGDQALAPSLIRFAAATRNSLLYNQVLESIVPPLSRNTLKAFINYWITFGKWDQVTAMLQYLRDYKVKTWGESNVTALAAAILKLERSASNEALPDHEREQKKESLFRAKDIMVRILNGEFNPRLFSGKPRKFHHERAIWQLHRLFSSIPGPLQEVARSASPEYQNPLGRDSVCLLPSVAFHILLDTVVSVRGSAAGKQLWEQWCIDLEPDAARRLLASGVYEFPAKGEHNAAAVYPGFDVRWVARENRDKIVMPNLNTVRIIARAAAKELAQVRTAKDPSAEAKEREREAREVLDFCVERYRRFGLEDKEIDRETGGHISRGR
ncbi:hypothetical protein VTN31DRAFT_1353 [Thermomyces dupontii]|uniref:uncharacterized protein n=1 Tax=Talaromyces thermophilus TaxID=28565 RepID=UPI003741FC87